MFRMINYILDKLFIIYLNSRSCMKKNQEIKYYHKNFNEEILNMEKITF